jgi:RNase P/RNase MRP subunit POP5
MGILRVPRENATMLGAALFFIHSLPSVNECYFRILHMGGTIKHCEEHAITFNQEKLKEMGLDSKTQQRLLERGEKDIRALNEG